MISTFLQKINEEKYYVTQTGFSWIHIFTFSRTEISRTGFWAEVILLVNVSNADGKSVSVLVYGTSSVIYTAVTLVE